MTPDSTDSSAATGETPSVQGAPLARVAARLSWPIEAETIRTREGDTLIRTTSGSQSVATCLDEIDVDYFASREEFLRAFRPIVGTGPVELTAPTDT